MTLRRLFNIIVVSLFLLSYTVYPAKAVSISQISGRLISESAILIDGDTGQILFEKNMHKVMLPASITKVMTALLALENGDLDDTIIITRETLRTLAGDAYKISLVPNEELTLKDALYALAVVSAADASNAIALHIGGTEKEFVRLMNERAAELGALNTNFVNAHGMPDAGHVTTAYDMALIAMAAVKTPGFNEIFSTHRYEMPPTNMRKTQRVFKNMNRMMTGKFIYKDLIAGKTGWTGISQYTLFTAAGRDDRTLICIVMKSPDIDDKYRDATMLLDYGFDEFHSVEFSIEELEDSFFLDAAGSEIISEFTVKEAFTCLIPMAFSKEDIKVGYIIDSAYDSDSNGNGNGESAGDGSSDDNGESSGGSGGDGNGVSSGDSEGSRTKNEVPVRVVFTLDDSSEPPVWQGSSELGEVAAFAYLIEEETDDLPEAEEDLPEPEELPEKKKPVASEKLLKLLPVIGRQANDGTDINTDHLSELSPKWSVIVKDAGAALVFITIVVCFFVNEKRRHKRGRD